MIKKKLLIFYGGDMSMESTDKCLSINQKCIP